MNQLLSHKNKKYPPKIVEPQGVSTQLYILILLNSVAKVQCLLQNFKILNLIICYNATTFSTWLFCLLFLSAVVHILFVTRKHNPLLTGLESNSADLESLKLHKRNIKWQYSFFQWYFLAFYERNRKCQLILSIKSLFLYL